MNLGQSRHRLIQTPLVLLQAGHMPGHVMPVGDYFDVPSAPVSIVQPVLPLLLSHHAEYVDVVLMDEHHVFDAGYRLPTQQEKGRGKRKIIQANGVAHPARNSGLNPSGNPSGSQLNHCLEIIQIPPLTSNTASLPPVAPDAASLPSVAPDATSLPPVASDAAPLPLFDSHNSMSNADFMRPRVMTVVMQIILHLDIMTIHFKFIPTWTQRLCCMLLPVSAWRIPSADANQLQVPSSSRSGPNVIQGSGTRVNVLAHCHARCLPYRLPPTPTPMSPSEVSFPDNSRAGSPTEGTSTLTSITGRTRVMPPLALVRLGLRKGVDDLADGVFSDHSTRRFVARDYTGHWRSIYQALCFTSTCSTGDKRGKEEKAHKEERERWLLKKTKMAILGLRAILFIHERGGVQAPL
ncbi:hypothetical protein EDB85DRAFT_1893468 [Lactarius pseudohatsudake]|nr:hypothetical protein EDB85DRAFT_1893468 [Lactarius pseudohatsudake]